MKAQELFDRLQNFGDLDPTTEQVIDWLDTWQKDIATEMPPMRRVTFLDVVAGSEYALPSSFLSVNEMINYDYDYTITQDNFIRFSKDAETLTILYNYIPDDITDLDDDLVVHPLLQPIALYFLIAMYYDKEGEGDEESAMAARWMQNYEYRKNKVIASINSKMGDSPVPTVDKLPKMSRGLRAVSEDDYYE